MRARFDLVVISMSRVLNLGLAGGGSVRLSADGGQISFQFLDSAGQPTGAAQVLDTARTFATGPVVDLFDADRLQATALATGGFAVAYYDFTGDIDGIERITLRLAEVGADGSITRPVFPLPLDQLAGGERISGAVPNPLQLFALDGQRFAVLTETFDANLAPTTHLIVTDSSHTIFDAVLSKRPAAVVEAPGDVAITFADGTREVLSLRGEVLAARGASHVLEAPLGFPADLAGFDPAHDQLRLFNPDGSVAGGAASTLTFDLRTHALSWDPDSEGPMASLHVGVLQADRLGVANLADDFRPGVLKVIGADGGSTVTWFDTGHSQPWDSLVATEDAAGHVLTYGWTLDDGTGKLFTFDVAGVQPWQRVVDDLDTAGHVIQRSVLYDDGQSWTAIFHFAVGQVVSYELDSFDATGALVGKSFFNADGTPI